jgi:hypothetical protein
MNCQDFEKITDELAREQMMEATERAGGLAHAEDCQRCAARLRDERTLSGGLRSLALSAEPSEAPARVEALLLSAFRELNRATPVTTRIQPAATIIPIAPVTTTAKTSAPYRWRWATAIAATLALLFVAFAATRLQPRQGLQPAQLASAHDPQPLSVSWDSSAQGQQAAHHTSTAATGGRGKVASQYASLRTQGRERRSIESAGSNRAQVSGETQPFVNTMAAASTGDDDDIATDFIPLTYGASLSGTDGGHVVRVELPRTAMAQFGLPVNAERSAEPVKADVLLGEDGLARAIRFVR